MTHDEIMRELSDERGRQGVKWRGRHDWGSGDCSTLAAYADVTDDQRVQWERLVKAAVLVEEACEAVQAALDVDAAQFKVEVVQALAVAYAILEGLPS